MASDIPHSVPRLLRCISGCLVIQAMLILLAETSLVLAAEPAAPQSLRAYRNSRRVLLIFAPSATDPRAKLQHRLLAGREAGFLDRDLVRFTLYEQKAAAPLRRQYGVRAGQFRVLLVGKDGNTAYSAARPVAASDLFGRIDRMPMRRGEMRRRGR